MDEFWVGVIVFLLVVVAPQVYKKISGRYIEGTIEEADEGQYEQSVEPTLLSGPKGRKSPFTLIWLILSQLLSVLLLIPWFFTIIAAQAAEGPWELLLAYMLLLHPVTATICAVVAWILYAKARYRLAAIITSLPLLPFVILFSGWIFYELVEYL